MAAFTSYLLACYLLFPLTELPAQSPGIPDSQPSGWLIFENLDLQLQGPFYDVAFYQDNLIFLKPGEERLYGVPMLRPEPGNSQPLFSNRDINCSPSAISFSGNHGKLYCSQPVLGAEKIYVEKIFEASIEGDQVSDLQQLSISRDASRSLHPAVSEDGRMMVFSSDRLPSSGGLDLFVSHLGADGWSAPVNLGDSINTSGHEWFPFLDRANNLWFSSTGHKGYGAYDIYVCPYDGDEWGRPRNLGASINGPRDELGFSVHSSRQAALFSRSGSLGADGTAIMISLNVEALDAAGIDEAAVRDIAFVLQGMADPLDQKLPAAQPDAQTASNAQTNSDPPAQEQAQPTAGSHGQVVFRVQIISSLYERSFPTVLINGESFRTFEYFYMGSYRICVGEFRTLEEANAFRLRCLDSGFKQAFVAAFRNGERVTDPSVFK